MHKQALLSCLKKFFSGLLLCLILFPLTIYASIIESSIGTAVVNDATATYFNPAALTLVKNPQVIGLGSISYFNSEFSGTAVQRATGFTLSGRSSAQTHYYLPALYFGMPVQDKFTVGIALITNLFNRDTEHNSILRYVQSNNNIQDINLVTAIGFKLNEYFSIGAGLDFSHLKFVLEPISGFPSLNIPDSQSRNETTAYSWGADIGVLIKPSNATLIGFNYRHAVTYHLNGTSRFEGVPPANSNDYHFKFWTPARSVFSINHFVTKTLGFVGTIQYIQWDIFKQMHIHNIATQFGIVPNVTVPYHLHNSWLVTLGTHYRINPKWIIRIAGSYIQSPANGKYQISNGDSLLLGGSTGYEISKNIIIDGGYSHIFIKNQNIHITTGRNMINGVNKGSRDGFSAKLTLNF